jgi:hypothetical protein
VNIREIGYFNDDRIWLLDNFQGSDRAAFINILPLDGEQSPRFLLAKISDEGESRTVQLNMSAPTRCVNAVATAPEPLFHLGENTVVEGQPYLLFAANKIFEVKDYAWDPDALEKSKLWVTVATLRESMEKRELSKQVENLVAATSESKAPSRQQIPDDVKLAVWTRDGQACVVCQSTQELQFDHIIPFTSGGGNTVENIQLLCRLCNLKKSDKIVF